MARPIVSDLTELFYEGFGFHRDDDATIGVEVPPRTNLAARPNSEAAALLTGSGTFTVTRVLAADEGIEPIIDGHIYLTKSTFVGGVDSNVGFFAYSFPSAGAHVISIYCDLASNWDGGSVEWSAESYTGRTEVDVLKAEPAGKGAWQRIVCKVTVLEGDLVGNLVLRAVPGFPTVGRAMYFDAKQIETGEEATEYIDGGLPRCEWSGTPDASTSTFLGGDSTWPLLRFLSGSVKPIEPVYELVRERDDGTPPWGILFDVDECPAERLPYLAQYPGCVLTPEMSEEQIRNEIREPTGWSRGRTPAIKIAGQRTLTGTKRVIVRPETPNLGEHYIRTLASETPDEERTRKVLRAALPPWEVLDYAAINGVDWGDIEASYADWDTVASTFTDWDDLEDTLPSELPEP